MMINSASWLLSTWAQPISTPGLVPVASDFQYGSIS